MSGFRAPDYAMVEVASTSDGSWVWSGDGACAMYVDGVGALVCSYELTPDWLDLMAANIFVDHDDDVVTVVVADSVVVLDAVTAAAG